MSILHAVGRFGRYDGTPASTEKAQELFSTVESLRELPAASSLTSKLYWKTLQETNLYIPLACAYAFVVGEHLCTGKIDEILWFSEGVDSAKIIKGEFPEYSEFIAGKHEPKDACSILTGSAYYLQCFLESEFGEDNMSDETFILAAHDIERFRTSIEVYGFYDGSAEQKEWADGMLEGFNSIVGSSSNEDLQKKLYLKLLNRYRGLYVPLAAAWAVSYYIDNDKLTKHIGHDLLQSSEIDIFGQSLLAIYPDLGQLAGSEELSPSAYRKVLQIYMPAFLLEYYARAKQYIEEQFEDQHQNEQWADDSASCDEWTSYTSPQHNFTALFPCVPTVERVPVNEVNGTYIASYVADNKDARVLISVAEFSQGCFSSADSCFAAIQDWLEDKQKSNRILDSSDKDFLGNPAVNVRYQSLDSDKFVGYSLFFIKDDSVYDLSVVGSIQDELTLKEIYDKLTQSFHFNLSIPSKKSTPA